MNWTPRSFALLAPTIGLCSAWLALACPPPVYQVPACKEPPTVEARKEGTPCPEDPPTPCVSLKIRVPAKVVAGQEIEYCLCVENTSRAPAHHVLVRNPVPANARFVKAKPEPTAKEPDLQLQLGTLDAGAAKEILLTLAPTEGDEIQNCARVQFEHGQCVKTRIARPDIDLNKIGPKQASLNETLTYQLTVKNTGETELSNIVLMDALPAGLVHSGGLERMAWDVGTLAPGECRSVDYQVVARAAGKLCSKASVTAAGGLRKEMESCVVVSEPKLALTKTGPAARYVNMVATFTLTVSNPGNAPARNVVVRDTLSDPTVFVSATAGGQLIGNEVQWQIGDLDAGATKTMELVVRATRTAKVCNQATARAEPNLSAQAEACTDFVGVPALLLEMIDIDDPIEVGAETKYDIVVRNQGSTPATNVVLVANVPEQLTAVKATGPADNRKEGNNIIFQPTTIPPKSDARYVVHVKALKAGDIRFRVDLTADVLIAGPVHEEESTTVYTDITSRKR